MKAKIVRTAAINAGATALYIAAVSFFLFYGTEFFGVNKGDSVFMPVIMLCLLVFSAAVTSLLMFGRPLAWYLDGRKKEALSLLAYTLGIFLGIMVLTLLAWLVV